jgi:hypothetical protein
VDMFGLVLVGKTRVVKTRVRDCLHACMTAFPTRKWEATPCTSEDDQLPLGTIWNQRQT